MDGFQRFAGTLLIIAVSILALVVLPVGLLIWWIESRFGAGNAAAILAAGAILTGVVVGWFMAYRTQKAALVNAAEFLHETAGAQRAQAGVAREYARIEREAFANRAKLDVLDAKRIEDLAKQRARLLTAQQDDWTPGPAEDTGQFADYDWERWISEEATQ